MSLSMNYVRQLDKTREEKPLLFSYRRCPYAMRARMALLSCGIDFDIYEISLKDKLNLPSNVGGTIIKAIFSVPDGRSAHFADCVADKCFYRHG